MSTKSQWGQMLQQKPVSNFPLKHMTHTGENPMYAAHVEDTFKVKPAKVGKLNSPQGYGVGSPWQAMAVKK